MEKKGEKNPLCLLRDIYRLIREFEIDFQQKHDLCLNEGMAVCSLKNGQMTSSDLANRLGLSASNMSKVLRAIEDKKLVKRMLGEEDKRQMYFTLTETGFKKLGEMACEQNEMLQVLEMIYKTKEYSTKAIL